MVVVCALMTSACGGNGGCGKDDKPKVCKTYGAEELMCPSGQICKYEFGDDPQDPEKYGKCEALPEDPNCKFVGPCSGSYFKECGYNAAFCDEQTGQFCYCDGPYPSPQDPTGGQTEKT